MIEKPIAIVSLIIILSYSCTTSDNPKNRVSPSQYNFKISATKDSSRLLLANFKNQNIEIRDKVEPQFKQQIIIRGGKNSNSGPGIYVLIDSSINNKSKAISNFLGKTTSISPGLHIDEHLGGYVYHSKKAKYVTFFFNGLRGGNLDYNGNDSVKFAFVNCFIDNMTISGDYGEKHRYKPIYLNKERNFSDRIIDSSRFQSVAIFGKELGEINVSTDILELYDCNIGENSIITTGPLNTLSLGGLHFASKSATLTLLPNGKVQLSPTFVMPDDNWDIQHKVLFTFGGVDLGQVDFDYQYFTYMPGRHYSENKKNYKDIIASQRRLNNQNGIIEASIDSAKYEDEQHFITRLSIPIKLWWNRYGFDKEKVIISTLEVFAIVWLVNLMIFAKVLAVYEYAEIKNRKKIAEKFPNKIKTLLSYLFLSFVYSGYLFFGLKFEINKLKLQSARLALWIIAQYVLGIIALAYIANLIIAK